MKNALIAIVFLPLSLALTASCTRLPADVSVDEKSMTQRASYSVEEAISGNTFVFDPELPSRYRGWDYLVHKLRADGIADQDLLRIFQDPRMPDWSPIPFRLRPRETKDMYASFTREASIKLAERCLGEHREWFQRAEKRFGVSRHVIGALIVVETHCGQVVGNQLVIERLARVSSVGEEKNIRFNLESLNPVDREETRAALVERARYLEDTFYPEMLALFRTATRKGIDVFDLRGSSAGAFGIPQFLPSSYMGFGVDGNADGKVSLFDFPDAIFSAARYLQAHGWTDELRSDEKMKVLWHYNRSEAYGEAVLKMSISLRHREAHSKRHTSPVRVKSADL